MILGGSLNRRMERLPGRRKTSGGYTHLAIATQTDLRPLRMNRAGGLYQRLCSDWFRGAMAGGAGSAAVGAPPSLLFMAATSVTRWIPDLKAVDKRLLADGRDRNLAVVATMRKVLALLGALPRDGCLPTPEPSPPEAAV